MPQFDQNILLPELSWLFSIFFLFYLFIVIMNKKNILKSFAYNKMTLKYLISFTTNITKYLEYCSAQYSIRIEKQIKWKLHLLDLNYLLNNLYNTYKVTKIQTPLTFLFKNFEMRKTIIKNTKSIKIA